MTGYGFPLAHHVFPGGTTDSITLQGVLASGVLADAPSRPRTASWKINRNLGETCSRSIRALTELAALVAFACSCSAAADSGTPVSTSNERRVVTSAPDGVAAVANSPTSTDEFAGVDAVPVSVSEGVNSSEELKELESLRAVLVRASALAESAVNKAVAACMALVGYTYVVPSGVRDPLVAEALSLRLWDRPQPARAATYGYLIPELSDIAELTPEPVLDPGYEAALNGKIVGSWEDTDPPLYAGAPMSGDVYDGCLPSARTQVVGEGRPERLFLDHDLKFHLDSFVYDATSRLYSSNGWQELDEEWAACMREKGFEYSGVADPLSFDWGDARPSAIEMATAVADAECKAAVAYQDRASSLYASTVATHVSENEAEVLEISDSIDALRQRAEQALA